MSHEALYFFRLDLVTLRGWESLVRLLGLSAVGMKLSARHEGLLPSRNTSSGELG